MQRLDINPLYLYLSKVAGKIMSYDPENGHRIKEPFSQVRWVHSVKKFPDFHMKQCLFSEHLLSGTSTGQSTKTVAIVESKKTALIVAIFIPDFIWLSTGEIHGCPNGEAMQVLCGRKVIFVPRPERNGGMGTMVTDEQRKAVLDIADFILMEDLSSSG